MTLREKIIEVLLQHDVACGAPTADLADAILSALESSRLAVGVDGELPAPCDGKEQYAFIAWATEKRYDMAEHPLHWLFLDDKTNAARQGWSAALRYVNSQLAEAKPAGEPKKLNLFPDEMTDEFLALMDEADACGVLAAGGLVEQKPAASEEPAATYKGPHERHGFHMVALARELPFGTKLYTHPVDSAAKDAP